LEAAYGLSPPEFRESRTYEQDFKIAIGKTMPGAPPTMVSVTAHGLAQDLALPNGRASPLLKFFLGCPPPLVKGLQGDLKEMGDLTLRQQMQVLMLTLKNQ
jgi:hypothetical protein